MTNFEGAVNAVCTHARRFAIVCLRGHPPVTCLSVMANAMQVAPTGPLGISGKQTFSCSASKAMRDKYLLTATTADHGLED
ncbi:uncharacterized protein LOC108096148 [Drosophila ficusphila]|uniref:uncharacterized protein LOC108096148 n=1 Tax=Drosophila ficusphila TaxID=30025 RepID=UPI0007E84791|nr:uncharacterized protein LOC108096148 [Drosophila ficusphila]